jgi:quercetin dioxygenase-like cupin family protein
LSSIYLDLLCAGEGYFEINGSRYEITPDYFFILPAHIPHKYGANSDNPWTIYWVHFTGKKHQIIGIFYWIIQTQ